MAGINAKFNRILDLEVANRSSRAGAEFGVTQGERDRAAKELTQGRTEVAELVGSMDAAELVAFRDYRKEELGI